MYSKTWALAAVLALATTAVADEGRPRIYFPRHIKRQFSNSSLTQEETFPADTSLPSETSLATEDETTLESRQIPGLTLPSLSLPDLDDILSLSVPTTIQVIPTLDIPTLSEIPNVTATPTATDEVDEDADEEETEDADAEETEDADAEETEDADAEETEDADDEEIEDTTPSVPAGGIVLAPTGILTSDTETEPTEASETVEELDETTPAEEVVEASSPARLVPTTSPTTVSSTTPGRPSITNILDPIIDPIEDIVSDVEDIVSDIGDELPIPPVVNITNPTEPPLVVLPIPSVTEPAEPIDTDTTEPPLIVLPIPSVTEPAEPGDTDTAELPSDELPISSDVRPAEPSPTTEPPLIQLPLPGISDPSEPGISNTTTPPLIVLPIPEPTEPSESDGPALTLLPIPEPTEPSQSDGPALTLLPIPDPVEPSQSDGSPLLPTLLPIPEPSGIVNGTDPNTNPPIDTTNPTDIPQPTSLPIEPTDISIPEPGPTAAPTEPPSEPTVVPFPPDVNATVSATDVPGISSPTSIIDEPTETIVVPGVNSTISEETATPTTPTLAPPVVQVTYTSVPAMTTVTGKQNWLGTQLVADDATATVNSDLPAPTGVEKMPDGMPNSIDASDEEIVQPDGTTLIRIVFDRRLHYEFVAENFTASQQIFMYLPTVIGDGEGVDSQEVKMMRLTPIETKMKKGWVTTAAFAYVPTSIIESLQVNIHLTNSALYRPSHPIAFALAAAIDPSYGIFPGSDLEVTGGNSAQEPGNGPFSGGEETVEEQTPKQKGATAGIAVGAVGAAVAYGAAMFLVARRYKRKKQAHRRTSSVSNTDSNISDMRFTDSGSPATAMMGGALLSRDFSNYGGVAGGVAGGRASHGSGQSGAGNSARTAHISAPVAAENSLGWN